MFHCSFFKMLIFHRYLQFHYAPGPGTSSCAVVRGSLVDQVSRMDRTRPIRSKSKGHISMYTGRHSVRYHILQLELNNDTPSISDRPFAPFPFFVPGLGSYLKLPTACADWWNRWIRAGPSFIVLLATILFLTVSGSDSFADAFLHVLDRRHMYIRYFRRSPQFDHPLTASSFFAFIFVCFERTPVGSRYSELTTHVYACMFLAVIFSL